MKTPYWMQSTVLGAMTFGASLFNPLQSKGQNDLSDLMKSFSNAQNQVVAIGAASEKALNKEVQTYNLQTVRATFANQKVDSVALNYHHQNRDIDALLLYYSGYKPIADKASGINAPDGTPIIQEKNGYMIVYHSKQQTYDTLETIYQERKAQTGFQILTTYDRRHNSLTTHLGGLDFNNQTDVQNASVALSMLSPRSAEGAVYGRKVINAFRAKHPEQNLKNTFNYLETHSFSSTSAAPMMLAFAAEGYSFQEVTMLAPFAALQPFQWAEKKPVSAPSNSGRTSCLYYLWLTPIKPACSSTRSPL